MSKAANKMDGLAFGMANASGKECKNAVANKMPTEKLTMVLIILLKKPKDKLAAIKTLAKPAKAVTATISCRVLNPIMRRRIA